MSRRRTVRRVVAVLVGVFIAMQLVPYGWEHPNPPVISAAQWPDAPTERIARDACYDCHSNETEWPVYSYVAPMSWLIRRDVDLGRDELNFSDWADDVDEADDAVETLREGSMPPSRYVRLHPEADLTEDEIRQLATALQTMERRDDSD